MLKKAIQRGRSERRGEGTFRYVEPLSDARTLLVDFFSIRLVAASRLQRNRRQLPVEFVKLLGRQGGIEQVCKVLFRNGVFHRVVIVRRGNRHKVWRKQALR